MHNKHNRPNPNHNNNHVDNDKIHLHRQHSRYLYISFFMTNGVEERRCLCLFATGPRLQGGFSDYRDCAWSCMSAKPAPAIALT